MNKEEFIEVYNSLSDETIDNLYIFSCLKLSGFDYDTAYSLIYKLKELWLKDENNYSISCLSDMLYNAYNEDFLELSTREQLIKMYESEYAYE